MDVFLATFLRLVIHSHRFFLTYIGYTRWTASLSLSLTPPLSLSPAVQLALHAPHRAFSLAAQPRLCRRRTHRLARDRRHAASAAGPVHVPRDTCAAGRTCASSTRPHAVVHVRSRTTVLHLFSSRLAFTVLRLSWN